MLYFSGSRINPSHRSYLSSSGLPPLHNNKTIYKHVLFCLIGESYYGVSLSKIVSKLKSLERYENVPRARVKAGLEHLMDNGNIYETRQNHYRVA